MSLCRLPTTVLPLAPRTPTFSVVSKLVRRRHLVTLPTVGGWSCLSSPTGKILPSSVGSTHCHTIRLVSSQADGRVSNLSDNFAAMSLGRKRPGAANRVVAKRGGFRGPASVAVSIEHGDYDDADDEVYETWGEADDEEERKKDPAENYGWTNDEDGTSELSTLTQDFNANITDEEEFNRQLSTQLLEMEEKVAQQKAKWAENSKPRMRVQQLDSLGRAYGRGSRKTASARVWIFPGEGNVTVNKKDIVDYFPRETDRAHLLAPFVATKTCGLFDLVCNVQGGGLTGKAGAIRLGLARALEKFNPEFRPPLRVLGYLTRDPRMVEMKKFGKKKARKEKQWVKR